MNKHNDVYQGEVEQYKAMLHLECSYSDGSLAFYNKYGDIASIRFHPETSLITTDNTGENIRHKRLLEQNESLSCHITIEGAELKPFIQKIMHALQGEAEQQLHADRHLHYRIEYDTDFASKEEQAIAVMCPHCKRWYNAREIVQEKFGCIPNVLRTLTDLAYAEFQCPICCATFAQPYVRSSYVEYLDNREDVLRDCYTKTVTWAKPEYKESEDTINE